MYLSTSLINGERWWVKISILCSVASSLSKASSFSRSTNYKYQIKMNFLITWIPTKLYPRQTNSLYILWLYPRDNPRWWSFTWINYCSFLRYHTPFRLEGTEHFKMWSISNIDLQVTFLHYILDREQLD